MSSIRVALQELRVGRKEYFNNLALFPLLSNKTVDAEYLTLDAAVAAKQVRIAKVSADGDVDALKIINRSPLPVLIVDGEELLGSKQGQVANSTVLVPPLQTIILPVCCVNQKSQRMAVSSPTSSISDIVAEHAFRLKRYVNSFFCNPMQVGVVFAINERIEGVELFDSSVTLASLYSKLIRSYAIDALENDSKRKQNDGKQRQLASKRDARRFLQSAMQAHEECYEVIGLGEEIRVTGKAVVGGGLLLDDRLLHLAAFANHIPSTAETIHFDLPRLAYP